MSALSHAAIFAQHFARMVLLAGGDSARRDEELDFAARGAEALLRSGPATLAARDWRLEVNGEPVPAALSGVPDLDLAARLTGHSVAEISFEEFAPRAELLAAAKAIATEPALGDRGRNMDTRFKSLLLAKVHLARSGSKTPPMTTTIRATPDAPGRPQTPAGAERPRASFESHARPRGIDHGTPVPLPPAPRPSDVPESETMARLDAAVRTGSLGRVLEDLVRDAETAALANNTRQLFEIMHAIVTREHSVRSGEVRTSYVITVKRLMKPVLLVSLSRHFAANRELQDEILAIFTRLGPDAAVLLVEALAESEQRFERRAIFDVLAKLKMGHGALKHSLTDPRWFVVRNAAELLGQIQAEGVGDDLVRLLSHSDERVRRAAATSLGQLGEPARTTEPLMRALADSSQAVRAAAATGLGNRRSAAALEALLGRLRKEDDDFVVSSLFDALARNGTPTAIRTLVEAAEPAGNLFKRKSSAYRSAATAALRNVESTVAVEALAKLKSDKDPLVRAAARA
jgi:HEAT repeat protein